MTASKTLLMCMISAVLLCGCASTWQELRGLVSSPAETYRNKARDLESQGEIRQALLAWRVVAQLEKKDTEAIEAIENLENLSKRSARQSFQQGLKYYQSGDYRNALRHFLITLRYQPHHKKARYYLKVRLQNREQATYTVKPGDSFTRIASKIYNDTSKAYMIAYFNDLDPRKPLLIGTTLLLPALEPNYLLPRANIRALLDRARKAYEKQRYEQVYILVRKIQDEIPGHPKAQRLADRAHFDQGKHLLKRGRYLAAVEQFKEVSPGYKGRANAISEARAGIRKLAVEEKLKKAQEYLNTKKWQSAINVTEEILTHEPGNTQARILFSNAGYNLGKQLLESGRTAKAADLLSRIDPAYEDTGELLALARARIRAKAEIHYREGVKHFINEDLESAIEDWKHALTLNPEHPKARQDMDDAQRLLDKLRAIEPQGSKAPKTGDEQ